MLQHTDFKNDEIGRYKTGRFYSESFSGVPYESDLLKPKGVGRQDYWAPFDKVPGGLQKTMRLIVLLHETSHYVHDLSLGTCLDIDYLVDQSNAILNDITRKLLSHGSMIQCPLLALPSRQQWLQNRKLASAFERIEEIEAHVAKLMAGSPGLAQYCTSLSPSFLNVQHDLEALSGLSLIEGLVATKTLVNLTDRIENEYDLEYLYESKRSLPILPEMLPPIYNVARKIFDETIGVMLLDGATYTDDEWPKGYAQSPRFLSDIGFIYLADIALHIPPFEIAARLIKTGKNTPEDFIPAYRFCKAIASLIRNGGFPDSSSSNALLFYNQLYDWFAEDKELHWPTIRKTNEAWKVKLAIFKQKRKESADGYRFRVLVERDQRPHSIVMGDPLGACWGQFVPVFHLTPNGFKTLRVYSVEDRWIMTPVEIPDMAVNEFFYAKYGAWKNMPAAWRWGDIKVLTSENNHVDSLRQEVIYRSLWKEKYLAMLHEKHLSCPFAQKGCSVAVASCKEITNLGDIPTTRCCLRDYMRQDGIDPARVRWS